MNQFDIEYARDGLETWLEHQSRHHNCYFETEWSMIDCPRFVSLHDWFVLLAADTDYLTSPEAQNAMRKAGRNTGPTRLPL